MGRARSDQLDGGGASSAETDYVQWDKEPGSVTVDLAADLVTLTSGDRDTITGFESAVGTDQDDTLLGTTGENTLLGAPGAMPWTAVMGRTTWRPATAAAS